MENHLDILVPSLGALLVLLPIIFFLFLRDIKKFKFLFYLFLTLTFGIVFLILLANYLDKENAYQLSQYSLASEDLEKINSLKRSLMGIGWPMKAMMVSPFYLIYTVLIYPILSILQKGLLQRKLG
ncbi:hypothetical protein [Sphingobacterium composti Ten et al. 2007 non Yoo et al. 2007]|uniref:hypothetical protein n=1 Tax=Sphingobacterium composti TaxID=363260 RepID=UPI00135B2FE5|nr:hypothetical protein [Sphingobacterium composti Ten et al. 2007 non Yoo et al. 2007]